MDTKTLISFLMSSDVSQNLTDPYWNQVKLLLRLDSEANSLGLPLYRDYSRYQYPVREWVGSSPDSRILILPNPSEGMPALPTQADISVQSFCYIPNKLNHSLRINQLNTQGREDSNLIPSRLEVSFAYADNLSLGTDDFTIEFSFFADELNLPWRWQTIWSAGEGRLQLEDAIQTDLGNLKTYIRSNAAGRAAWGCFLKDADLLFIGMDWEIKINTSPIEKLKWYHVCIQRTNGVLKCFLNANQTYIGNFTKVLNVPSETSYLNKIFIGASIMYQPNSNIPNAINQVDVSFSGGFTNFRITGASRYPSNFYTTRLPFPTLTTDNRIDPYYGQTLFNLPFTYDYFDYSNNYAHFKNKQFLKYVPNFQAGFLPITGFNKFETKAISHSLNQVEWTIEFYICYTLNGNVFYRVPRDYNVGGDRDQNLSEWLRMHKVNQLRGEDSDTIVNLVSLQSYSNKILDINLHVMPRGLQTGGYFAVKASTNGTDWISFPFDDNINWSGLGNSGPPYILPNDEIKFLASYDNFTVDGLPLLNTRIIPSAFHPKNKHIAISKYNNLLYILIDGEVIKTVPFDYTLYTGNGQLSLIICNEPFQEILGSDPNDNNAIKRLGFALKGVRVTNLARYSFTQINAVHQQHNTQPLALAPGVIPPARARVVDIQKTTDIPSISTQTATWDVYISQPVDDLTLNDFTLSGTGGIIEYSLTSLTKVSDYKYLLTADTGSNNGELGINFIDRRTVKYRGMNKFISNFVGELDTSGQTYIVNKSAPMPILTSGSNPYVSDSFTITLTFDAAIDSFNSSNIGLVNCFLTNVRLIDEDAQIYELTILPVKEGVVIVQCMEGVGVTDGNLPSPKSAPLVRIYSQAFPILQTPLNLANTIYDLSPTRVVLDDVIDNNTQYSTSIYPVGESSSLHVKPLLEQSGLRYIKYNAVGSTIDMSEKEWTIEFFLRINSGIGTGKAHIFSVENASTGFCVFNDVNNLRIQRTVYSTGNLLGNLVMANKDTPSFVNWSSTSYTQLQKFPHFAITYKDGVYRFYRNGKRVGLVQSSTLIDISKGDLYIGYYPNRVDDIEYYLSNIRLTVGKALYTSYEVNVPGLPYTVLPDITEEAELLSYISIYSTNQNSQLARTGDTLILKFSSIISLQTLPIVTILGREAAIVSKDYNSYEASIEVESIDLDGQVPFSITIEGEPSIPTKIFDNTTNNSKVFVDNIALEASITSDSPDDNYHIIPVYIQFTEPVRGLSADNITLVNCKLSNLSKVSGENRYSFILTGINSGEITATLTENTVQDLAGNYNLPSNIFSRNVVVPAYVPDPNYANVLLLLQPESTIIDESAFNLPLTITNVELSNVQAPQGLTKSLYFNGKDSSVNLNLQSTLTSLDLYTIEFFCYFKSNVVFRLPRPNTLPADDITSRSFTANWEGVENASSYVLDVSKQSNFSTYLPGYRNLSVGNSLSSAVSSDKLDSAPTIKYTRLRSGKGFIGEWSYIGESMAYRYDLALDSLFNKKLYNYTNRLVKTPYALIGDLSKAQIISTIENPPESQEESLSYNPQQGVVLTGILSNTNYPKLYYFLEENTVRLYPKDGYIRPALAEDIEPLEWYHIAITNDLKYTRLYINGEETDKVRNTGFATEFDIGYSIGHFYGYLTGLRITKGVQRYTSNYDIPSLPFSKN